ncbi:MAG TPA: histidine kinase [Candidatus Limnocylindrales bacterium]|nr:histidine kinase [Candidatus Limnocylindrales bacterium]
MPEDQPPASGEELAARLADDVATLDRELAEIDMLVGQARTEATRHEQRRAAAAEKLGEHGDAEGYAQLVQLTRRAVLMDAQVDLLDGKRRALARHRDAIAGIAAALGGLDVASLAVPSAGATAGAPDAAAELPVTLPPSLSRVVLNAQEDLRREIARAMHDGPAQSLTNIVLQAQIVDRLVDKDAAMAKGELTLLTQMVQQTLDATKAFIFDVRPMVLDDLGLVPTLRRAARDRGRRAHVPVEFDSLGADRRLPQDVESTVFRILDEALGAYLAQTPDRVVLRLDWADELEAVLAAERGVVVPRGHEEALPDIPGDAPDQIRRMIEDRHEARTAALAAAEEAAIVVLPPNARRDILERAGSIGATVEVDGGGSQLRLVVPLPAAPTSEDAEPADEAPAG